MTTKEWAETISVIKATNAYFANYHINKKIEVEQESEEIQLSESYVEKGHYKYVPF